MFDAIFANLAAQVGAPFTAATAYWPGQPSYDTGGSVIASGNVTTMAVRAQFDAATQAMRLAEGFRETDARCLVLAAGLPHALDTTTRINVCDGPYAGDWSVLSVVRDPAGIGFECRVRRAS